jgi:hypothetical protein
LGDRRASQLPHVQLGAEGREQSPVQDPRKRSMREDAATAMDAHWSNKDQEYLDSVGNALNVGVNELADVLHTFFLNVVQESDD